MNKKQLVSLLNAYPDDAIIYTYDAYIQDGPPLSERDFVFIESSNEIVIQK